MDKFNLDECRAAVRACKLENPTQFYRGQRVYFDSVRLYDSVRCVYDLDTYRRALWEVTNELEAEYGKGETA